MPRHTNIDIARGIAIIAVIIGHLWCFHPEYLSIKKYVYCFHVPLFFMLAGMCLKPCAELRIFVSKKFMRLIVPYVSFGMVALFSYTIAVGFFFFFFFGGLMRFAAKRSWGFLYGATCPVKLCGNYTVCEAGMIWFLLALFISFVLVAMLGKSVRGWIIITLLMALSVILKWMGCPLLPFSLQAACIGALFVGAGMLLKRLLVKIADHVLWNALLVLIGCCAYVWVVSRGLSQNIARIEFDSALVPACSLMISAGVIGLAGFLKYVPGLSWALSFVGMHTMSVYGMHHIYISGGLASIARRCASLYPGSRIALLVVEVLFPLVAGTLLVLIIKKLLHGKKLHEAKECKMYSLDFDGTAVVSDDGRQLTYSELAVACDKWATMVPRRSLVFLLVKNNLESLIAYVGALRNGIVPLMLDADIDGSLLQQFLDAYRPLAIYNGKEGRWSKVSESSPPLNDELALLLTTSGSTGSPKLVRQSYRNIEANTASIIEYLKLDETEKAITTLPMNYTYGLSIINSHLNCGATLLMTTRGIMEREFWTFFNAQGATSFGGVPYTYEMLDRLMFFRRKLPSLKTMTQAGGKILVPLHEKFAKYAAENGKNFVVMYGQCEATARMSYLPPERALDKIGSMGIAIPGGKFSLIDVDGSEITQPDVPGELVYTGDNVTLGYAECADDLAKGDERHGLLVTGDIAKVDADGFYFIVGRKKRFLKIFGNRVNLDETERIIKAAFPGLDCACGGVDDKMRIYLTDETRKDAVRDFVSGKTHLNASAFEIVVISSIPKNASGKTLYSELR